MTGSQFFANNSVKPDKINKPKNDGASFIHLWLLLFIYLIFFSNNSENIPLALYLFLNICCLNMFCDPTKSRDPNTEKHFFVFRGLF